MADRYDRPGVVVVAYHHADALRRALEPLRGLDVVVIDNSSSVEVATVTTSCKARYIDAGANLGFAAGVNLGVRQLPVARDILLLNPDAVIETAAIDALVRRLKSSDGVAAVSPTYAMPAGGSHRVAWPFPTPTRAWASALLPGRHGRDEFLVGACMLIERAAWDDIGAFDERFFLYAEETDWQRRGAFRGWHFAVADEVTATHEGAGTSDDPVRRESLFHAGTETYVRKWHGPLGWASFRLATLLGAAIRGLFRGSERASDWRRFRIFLRGPRRMAGLVP